jgi:hypothetical protein
MVLIRHRKIKAGHIRPTKHKKLVKDVIVKYSTVHLRLFRYVETKTAFIQKSVNMCLCCNYKESLNDCVLIFLACIVTQLIWNIKNCFCKLSQHMVMHWQNSN